MRQIKGQDILDAYADVIVSAATVTLGLVTDYILSGTSSKTKSTSVSKKTNRKPVDKVLKKAYDKQS
jgi:hypothetical protein